MGKKILWFVVSGLMALSLVVAACGPAATTTTPTTPTTPVTTTTTPTTPTTPTTEPTQKEAVKPAAEVPKYGGTLLLSATGDITRFNTYGHTTGGATIDSVNQGLWSGDWTHGNAGGYGTNQADWAGNPDIFKDKIGVLAESTTWTVDEAKDEGTIVYKIRQGVHWALNPKSAASRAVNGRELTAADVIFYLNKIITDTTTYLYQASPEIRSANITKTGPWEITVRVPINSLISTVSRFGDSIQLTAPEVWNNFNKQDSWKDSVGTGTFMVDEYISGSTITLIKNPNSWETDPIGPGKGNKLPYLDSVKYLILPDASTRAAALRTAKIDVLSFNPEDSIQLRKQLPELRELVGRGSGSTSTPTVNWRTDLPPFNDVRVRRALMMAIDFKGLSDGFFNGQGQYPNRPFADSVDYVDLYMGLNDPRMPADVKELWSYNPEKAKALLKEAGYPSGFKTSVVVTSTEVDNWSIYKDMWAKVNIELALDVKDTGPYNAIVNGKNQPAMIVSSGNPIWYTMPAYSGTSSTNRSHVDDTTINDVLVKARRAMVLDPVNGEKKGMNMLQDIMPYIYSQVYEIGGVSGPQGGKFWWPWLKNFSGEANIGYFQGNWYEWVWYDQDLKKSMGH